jgi:hypothetical protein
MFKSGHEEMRDELIGESSRLAFIQEDLTIKQHKVYKDAWEEAGQRSNSEKEELWTVAAP